MQRGIRSFVLLAALALPVHEACAQLVARVVGSFGATLPDGGALQAYFRCSTLPSCTGVYIAGLRIGGCSNLLAREGALTIDNLQIGPEPSRLVARMTLANAAYDAVANADGTCGVRPGSGRDLTFLMTGPFNGSTGIFQLRGVDERQRIVAINGSFSADLPDGAPVFPLSIDGQIDLVRAAITATVRPRLRDTGLRTNLYVFARAPANRVKGAVRPKAGEPEPCVTAQLSAGGELQAVSTSQLQASVSAVLSAQGQSVTVLDNVPTAGVGGATFYVGYGDSPAAMIASGTNRTVVTVPSTVSCQPQPPQDGWWWNPQQGGRGFSLESRGPNLFFAAYLYEPNGHATWLAATGPTAFDGSSFSGELLAFSAGQTLTGPYVAPASVPGPGPISLTFTDATHGVMAWPGGQMAIERFDVVPGGVAATPVAGQPETGWWWNPDEGGRGYFIEWQGANAFVAGYMYEANGAPVWYASFMATPDIAAIQGTWQQFGGGQSLTGAYQPATLANPAVGPLAIAFASATSATLTLPNGRRIPITRFRF